MTKLSRIGTTPLSERWDKLQSWQALLTDLEKEQKSNEKSDQAITLNIGPQLLHTIRHPRNLRCADHFTTKLGEVFTTHYNKGAKQTVKVWTLQSKEKDAVCKNVSFETGCEITSITYVSKHRTYLAFCRDLHLRVFTDANSNFVEVHSLPRLSTILCLIYNKEEDEVYAGGIGLLEEWRIHGAEHAASAVPGRKFQTNLTNNEWIWDIKIDRLNNHMFAVHGDGIIVINYTTRQQTSSLPNRHDGPLKCCCFYSVNDILITGGADCKIKMFNGTSFNLLHVFLGHNGPVTSVEPHPTDSLLFSSSHDGTIRIWRIDSFKLFLRLDVGERIHQLSLLSSSEFYFRTDTDIHVYNLNQFYQLFAPVESETRLLLCCRATGRPTRILGSTEDGSIRLFSPVTGLTLTIIYPMPSFQVLTSFAYDLHQDRLHTVLADGKIQVYNTGTNPCKAEEVWVPSCEDEEVNKLVLVTVEFMTEEGADVDNLVFAGLRNGQIILCEAVVCILEIPIQAHEGSLVCLESCLHLTYSDVSTVETSNIIISAGTDNYVKIWLINVDAESRRPSVSLTQLIKIHMASRPSHVCMFSKILCVNIGGSALTDPKSRLIMYHLISTLPDSRPGLLSRRGGSVCAMEVTHPTDEDHGLELTALDKSPVLKIILTSGKDGFVKIWNTNNELLREMNFATSISAACFANDRGDILVGYGTHVCSISVLDYLPLNFLRDVVSITQLHIKDDTREFPVQFDHQSEPWLELKNLRQYSLNIFERRKQRLEEEFINRLRQATAKEANAKFVIFVDQGTTKVIRKDLADRLVTWAKGKTQLKFGHKHYDDPHPLHDSKTGLDDKQNAIEGAKDEKGFRSNALRLRQAAGKRGQTESSSLIEIYPSGVGKALRLLGQQATLDPYEMKLLNDAELLEKDPIIAPDGYIPNSVIRKKINPPPIDPPIKRIEKFELKPVPKVNPSHLPSWWGADDEKEEVAYVNVETWDDSPSPISMVSSISLESIIESPVKRYIEEGKTITLSPKDVKEWRYSKGRVSSERPISKISSNTPNENVRKAIRLNSRKGMTPSRQKKSGWEDSTVASERPETGRSRLVASALSDGVPRSGTNVSNVSEGKHPATPGAYKPRSAVSRRSSAVSVRSSRASSAESVKSRILHKMDLRMGTPDSVRRGRQSAMREKSKSFKLTNLAVDEDSSMIHPKESKSGRKTRNAMSSEIIQQLMTEKWMPAMEGDYDYEDVLDTLITVLEVENPVVYDSVCGYIATIFGEIGIPEKQLEATLAKLGMNLNHVNTAIKKYTIRTMQSIGQGRQEVLLQILPKLVDPDVQIRKMAAEAIEALTGATDQSSLLNILDSMGVTGGFYSSKEDEALAFAVLAERFKDREEDPHLFDRIQDWVEDTTPGLYDIVDPDDDLLYRDGSKSRKSTLYQGKESSFLSERSVIDATYDTSGRNTMYADLPMSPDYSSDGSELAISRGMSVLDSKSVGLKSEKSRYNARMDLMDRMGASVIPSERVEQPTPISDIDMGEYPIAEDRDDLEAFMMEGQGHSPFMMDDIPLLKETSSLTNKTNKSADQNDYEEMLLKERTLTDLSQVGPLPKFLAENSTRNFDDMSTDSAFESGISISDYAQSHFSEKFTVSHADQQSSKHSQISEENNMFDVDLVSTLDYEGSFDETLKTDAATTTAIVDADMHENDNGMTLTKSDTLLSCMSIKDKSMSSDLDSDEFNTGQISVEITPRQLASSGKKDGPVEKMPGQRSSMRSKKFGDIDGFSTISDHSTSSRRSSQSDKDKPPAPVETFRISTQESMDTDKKMPVTGVDVKFRKNKQPTSQDKELATADKKGPTKKAKDGEKRKNEKKGSEKKDVEKKQAEKNVVKKKDGKSKKAKVEKEKAPVQSKAADSGKKCVDQGQKGQQKKALLKVEEQIEEVADIENVELTITQPTPLAEETIMPDPVAMDTKLMPNEVTRTSLATTDISELTLGAPRSTPAVPHVTPAEEHRAGSPRFTPKDPGLYRYYDKQKLDSKGRPVPEDKEEDKDSDIHSASNTISNITSSQITERLSGQDSGIGRDMSYQGSYGRGVGKGYGYGAPLSPVKSEPGSAGSVSSRHSPQDWRKFFEMVPNAVERRQMEQIKRDIKQGKLRQASLPPISYFAEDLPMLPGEAGTRLLKTVHVGEKLQDGSDGRHRIESVPGKLAVHTRNEAAGTSNFGILKMQWTTGVPTVKERCQPPQRLPRQHERLTKSDDDVYAISSHSLRRLHRGTSEEELNLPYLATATPPDYETPNQFEWEFPLPPPPAKESRTSVPHIKKEHDSYCKYYQLVKRKLHLYTSPRTERGVHLPEVWVRKVAARQDADPSTRQSAVARLDSRALTKYNLGARRRQFGAGLTLPPIKLGQLVKIY